MHACRPKDLTDLIDQMMGKMGYKTRTEFVKDAVRRLLSAYGIPQRMQHACIISNTKNVVQQLEGNEI